jgi:quinol monooxygenase YgiN
MDCFWCVRTLHTFKPREIILTQINQLIHFRQAPHLAALPKDMILPSGRHLLRRPRTIRGNSNHSSSTRSRPSLAFVSIILTLLLVLVASSPYLRPIRATVTQQKMPVFTLLVTLTFSADEHKQTFLREIQPVADHVRSKEPHTLAYEVLLSDTNPLQVLMLERYTDKENAYLQVHKSSEPFLEFRSKLQKLQEQGHVTIEGHSYLDAGIGFGDRGTGTGKSEAS